MTQVNGQLTLTGRSIRFVTAHACDHSLVSARRSPRSLVVSRRVLLRTTIATGAAGVLAAVAGCGVRLQEDAPEIPFLTRQKSPDEDLLLAAYHRENALAAATALATSPDPALTDVLRQASNRHSEHSRVLRAILSTAGVPDHLIDPPAAATSATSPRPVGSLTPLTSTGTTSSTPTVPAPVPTDVILGLASVASSSTVTDAIDTASTYRLQLASVAAHAGILAVVLGAPQTVARLPGAAAARLLPPLRAAAYAVEVAIPRLPASDRVAAVTLLASLRARERVWVTAAGPSAPVALLGYTLPGPVTSPETAVTTVRAALGAMIADCFRPLDLPLGATGELTPMVTALVATQIDVLRHSLDWGMPLRAFPGLSAA